MNVIAQAIAQAGKGGVSFAVAGNDLVVNSKRPLTNQQRAWIANNKPLLLEAMRQQQHDDRIKQTHDAFMAHLSHSTKSGVHCCYAPIGRYCETGAALRATYDAVRAQRYSDPTG